MSGWEGQALNFRWEQPLTHKLQNVEWITIRKEDGTEEHWPVEVEQIINNADGSCTVRTKAFGT